MYRKLALPFVIALTVGSVGAVGDQWPSTSLTPPRATVEGWSPERAARYLDSRQADWFEWKTAAAPEGPCVSCHTGMTYLLARPALRQRLGEAQPTRYETGLLGRLRHDVGNKAESYLRPTEVVFAALFLGPSGSTARVTDEGHKALDQLWALQEREGASKGGWDWLMVNLDPWEHSQSTFFGTAIAALAVGNAGAGYAAERGVAAHVADLKTYFQSAATARRPLHDRLALLWAASKQRDILSAGERTALIELALAKQQADGGWDVASLGPWDAHPDAPANSGSSSYATAFVTFVLQRAGVSSFDARLSRAIAWLTDHQDRESGAWPAVSMNKKYPAGSMQSMFMQDAATAFASLALIEAGR